MKKNNEYGVIEIMELAHSLRQEHLFISSEQNTFTQLNDTLLSSTSDVYQLAWICAHQRLNLNRLITSRPHSGPSQCCQRANNLEHTSFIDVFKAKGVKYQHMRTYIELFNFLHQSPQLLAQSLTIADGITCFTSDQMNSIVQTITTGLYGNAILSKDVNLVLRLLSDLIEMQVIPNDNPKRMLLTGSCSFSRVFQRLHESIFSAKLFLTAALYNPIMQVLIGYEELLDIDPSKSIANYPPSERLKKFGVEGTIEYEEKLKQYRYESINVLFKLSNIFIKSLSDNWTLFPSTLQWVVQTMHHSLKAAHVNEKDINDILTDMVFTNFICPAIVSPDLYGISDAPISETSRFNLIQIGQIIQMLAIVKHEEIDYKFIEIFEMFNRNLVSELMQRLLQAEHDINISVTAIPHLNDFGRTHVLITQTDLQAFVDFLRSVLCNDGLVISGDDRRRLGKLLDQLPDKYESIINDSDLVGGNGIVKESNRTTASDSFHKTKHSLINLGKSTKNKLSKTIHLSNDHSLSEEIDDSKLPLQSNSTYISNNSLSMDTHKSNNQQHTEAIYDQVLLIPLVMNVENTFQLLTEEQVLNLNDMCNENPQKLLDNNSKEENAEFVDQNLLRTRKHTRFLIANDDQSIGNTSDNLEAVSEARSNNSVTSSLEMEENYQNLNDNLSDMVSANVSGRGTPNISGRDTPSSQVTEGETNQITTPHMTKILTKARSDIEDKFCKFEIRKVIEGDETISLISDTWSTDVLASDSEIIETVDRERNFSTPIIPSDIVLPGDDNFTINSSQVRIKYSNSGRTESKWMNDLFGGESSEKDVNKEVNEQNAMHMNEVNGNNDGLNIKRNSHSNRSKKIVRGTDVGHSNRYNSRTESVGVRNSRFNVRDALNEIGYNSEILKVPNRMHGDSTDDTCNCNKCNSIYGKRSSSANNNISSANNLQMEIENNKCIETENQMIYQECIRDRNKMDSHYGLTTSSNINSLHQQNSSENNVSNQGRRNCEDNVYIASRINFNQDLHEYSSKANACNNTYNEQRNLNLITEKSYVDNFSGNNTREHNSFAKPHSTESEVEHRYNATEGRSASFDGRRNGMLSYHADTLTLNDLDKNNSKLGAVVPKDTHTSVIFTTDDLLDLSSAADEDKTNIINKTNSLSISATSGENGLNINGTKHIDDNNNNNKLFNNTNNQTEENDSVIKNRYTGAIPKSISFDASADKADRNQYFYHRNTDQTRLNTGFFKKIKDGFKNRRSGKFRGTNEMIQQDQFPGPLSAMCMSLGNGLENPECKDNDYSESSEDILAKYRRKISSSSSSETTNVDSLGNNSINRISSQLATADHRPSSSMDDISHIYSNVKRKLRLVLSTTDLCIVDFKFTNCHTPLLTYLQIQFAQALNLQDLQQISFVSEAIRCVNALDSGQQQKVLSELEQDLVKRQCYLQYLVRSRQKLLSALQNIDRVKDRLHNDRTMCNRHLIMVCVRMYMEKREKQIEQFQNEFSAICGGVDEKIDFMNDYLDKIMDELKTDGILNNMVDWQLNEARICIERILLQNLYRQVMFPNDDGDISRDEVIREHIKKINESISPSHPAIRIPSEYFSEAPWPFAQQQIVYISAYKTPKEKVKCVVKCISSIMHLLQMASNRIPSADDLVPVLIYVIIKANPPYLLSTIQYVNAFIGEKLNGEDHYWWTQFCSAVAFIKTMDYGHN